MNELRNARGDRSYLATVQLQKRFAGGQEIGVAYTYTDSKDRMSAAADLAVFNVGGNALDGPIDDRRLRTSSYSVPHKITVVGAVDLPLHARFSVFYIGYSGQPYTYLIQGDADAARYAGNDIVYVPTDAADITLADPAQYPDLDRFIQSEPCLREPARAAYAAQQLPRPLEHGGECARVQGRSDGAWPVHRADRRPI